MEPKPFRYDASADLKSLKLSKNGAFDKLDSLSSWLSKFLLVNRSGGLIPPHVGEV
jgi:hypothetical protein